MWTITTTIAVAAALATSSTAALAQNWPTRPVTMVVPFAAGGPGDVFGRIIAIRLAEVLGQTVIVENVGAGGGMAGAARVAKATPDGYQFVYGNIGTHAQSQTLYKHRLYNAATDFAPVALVTEASTILTARKTSASRRPDGIRRVCQSQSKQDAVWLGRRGISLPSRLPVVQRGDRGECHPHPLSQQRAVDSGHDCRPRRLPVRKHCSLDSRCRKPTSESNCHSQPQSRAGLTKLADSARTRARRS